jgi:hypothetical protein
MPANTGPFAPPIQWHYSAFQKLLAGLICYPAHGLLAEDTDTPPFSSLSRAELSDLKTICINYKAIAMLFFSDKLCLFIENNFSISKENLVLFNGCKGVIRVKFKSF